MLYLLSPAKSLDFETPLDPAVTVLATRPAFVPQAAELVGVLRQKTPAELASLMKLSDGLAALNVGRYAAWRPIFDERHTRPAALTFSGAVYGGLDARSLGVDDLRWAQSHLVILSGLYGVLRPLDRLRPYRLEMGTRLATARAKDLYCYWGDTLAEHLNRLQRRQRPPIVVNLASQEYFRAVARPALKARVVDCVFEDRDAGGGWRVIGVLAKRARGLMARHAIEHRIEDPRALEGFDREGYAFARAASTPDRLVFRRRTPPARPT
jgi:uncharacterized protein